jgi:hypothetical protein
MARKPKTQPSPEAAMATPVAEPAATNETPAPARQGRKGKGAPLSPALPLVVTDDNAPTNDIVADAAQSTPVGVPRRGGPNRKPTPPAPAAAAPLAKERTKPGRGRTSRQPEPEATPDPVMDDAQDAGSASQPETAASADPVPVDADPDSLSDGLQQPLPGLDVPSPTKPAADWDRVTDTVQFDWPAIERTAAEDGPNQAMAKLLVAARAEGANSRWPL